MTISVSLQMQNGKIRVFLHNNSQNQKFRRTTYPYSWTTSPSPDQLPFPPTHWLSSFYQPDSHTKYEINSSNSWKLLELSQPNKAQLLAEDYEYQRIASQGTIDPSLVLLDKFTQISLDAYWQEIVRECRMHSPELKA